MTIMYSETSRLRKAPLVQEDMYQGKEPEIRRDDDDDDDNNNNNNNNRVYKNATKCQ